jgi:hypothetical protein
MLKAGSTSKRSMAANKINTLVQSTTQDVVILGLGDNFYKKIFSNYRITYF